MRNGRLELKKQDAVAINAELLNALEAIPASNDGNIKVRWTEEMDAALIKYWPIKRKESVARALGISETTCRWRYRLLTEG